MSNPIGVRLTKGLTFKNDLETLTQWYHWMKEVGFDAVDVPDLTVEVKQAVEAAGLAIGSFDANKVPQLFSRDEKKRSDAIAGVRKQMAEAAELGGKVCFMCLKPEDNDMPRNETFALYKEVFPEIAADAERLGIKIVYEGYPGSGPFYPTIGCTPEMLRAMFAAVPSKALCVNYDPSHLIRLGIDHLRFLREFIDRVGHVHAKDCQIIQESVYLYGRNQKAVFEQPIQYSEGPWRYIIPGEGEGNWAAIAFELELAGYSGAISIELEDHRYKGSVENVRRGLVKTMNYLSKHFR